LVSDARLHHRRFFVPPEDIQNDWVKFAPAQARQITQVLRLRPGDTVAVFDGTGREIVAALAAATPRQASARILREVSRVRPPELSVTLAQVIPRGNVMDLIVGKATELGVSRIVPLEAERSVRRATARGPRWQRIAQEAAEQCGRPDLPELAPVAPLEAFLCAHPRAFHWSPATRTKGAVLWSRCVRISSASPPSLSWWVARAGSAPVRSSAFGLPGCTSPHWGHASSGRRRRPWRP
jgi:RsmE family RNA methyltransferase